MAKHVHRRQPHLVDREEGSVEKKRFLVVSLKGLGDKPPVVK
jgi:hypothetical protein